RAERARDGRRPRDARRARPGAARRAERPPRPPASRADRAAAGAPRRRRRRAGPRAHVGDRVRRAEARRRELARPRAAPARDLLAARRRAALPPPPRAHPGGGPRAERDQGAAAPHDRRGRSRPLRRRARRLDQAGDADPVGGDPVRRRRRLAQPRLGFGRSRSLGRGVQGALPAVDPKRVTRAEGGTAVGKPINVLVVDDDAALCEMLRATFELEGIEVEEAHHVVHAEKAIAHRVPDAIVLDIGLPGVDGAFYVERLRESGHTKHSPVVAISGSEDAGIRALANGANAFVRKPLDPLRLVATVERTVSAPDEKHDGDLLRLLQIAQRQHELLADAYRQTLESLAQALESRDFGTSAHSRRVVAYATRLTLEVAPSLVDDPTLEWGFLLHDVGKIGIPDQILLKPGKLTAGERRRMEQHPEIGERLVGHVPLLQGEGINVVRSHHERWDGS